MPQAILRKITGGKASFRYRRPENIRIRMTRTVTLTERLPSNNNSHRALNNTLSIPVRDVPPLPETIELLNKQRIQLVKRRLSIKHQKERPAQIGMEDNRGFGIEW